jgi:hypothetical protein
MLPSAILCEFEDSKTNSLGYTYKILGDYLVACGYHVFLSEWYPIDSYGSLHRHRSIRRYPCSIIDSSGWGNFLAFQKENDADKITAKYVGLL